MSPDILTIEELPRRVRTAGDTALASGALIPIRTRVHYLEDGKIPFAIRVSENMTQKNAAGKRLQSAHDPFSPPYEPDLYIGGISSTHVALLNKYNVLPDHLLLVTRSALPQTDLLDVTDFEAALLALAAFDGLVFYNGGREGGASQSHKHLQLVPLPLVSGPTPFPFASILEPVQCRQAITRCDMFPFRHAISAVPRRWWHAPHAHASDAMATWHELWRSLGHEIAGQREQPLPYNMLMTRERIWLVPRSRGEWEGIGVNALGYTGTLLVRDEAQYDQLRKIGPLRLLTETGLP